MNINTYFKEVQRKLVYALRQYPLQILGAGMVVALFLFVFTLNLMLPHKTHEQTLSKRTSSRN